MPNTKVEALAVQIRPEMGVEPLVNVAMPRSALDEVEAAPKAQEGAIRAVEEVIQTRLD